MRAENPKPLQGQTLGLMTVATVLFIGSVVAQFDRAFEVSNPRVGDIVMFHPGAEPGDTPTLSVRTATGVGCQLDIPTIQRGGGSLIVESRLPNSDRPFRVHWAGARTHATADANCGKSAELLLTGREMRLLAFAAGGYGVGLRPR